MLCLAVLCLALPDHALPYFAVLCRAWLCLALPCAARTCIAVASPAMHGITMPYVAALTDMHSSGSTTVQVFRRVHCWTIPECIMQPCSYLSDNALPAVACYAACCISLVASCIAVHYALDCKAFSRKAGIPSSRWEGTAGQR